MRSRRLAGARQSERERAQPAPTLRHPLSKKKNCSIASNFGCFDYLLSPPPPLSYFFISLSHNLSLSLSPLSPNFLEFSALVLSLLFQRTTIMFHPSTGGTMQPPTKKQTETKRKRFFSFLVGKIVQGRKSK